ncbi:hypothetical protein POTOM_056962 [Populus tomentosa]|uniref:Peptidase S54 rhomboid domain-containing protein n=1 Tax=Populus tomentosa TaxID=118781 RepID=A0A8X7XYU9_POPTO|nr:hypothetical protein POTOM_056962 [Populus tomentosa]
MGQFQFPFQQKISTLKPCCYSFALSPIASHYPFPSSLTVPPRRFSHPKLTVPTNSSYVLRSLPAAPSRFVCKSNGSVTFYCVIVCIRYDKAAGTWEARRKKETGEARKWDILDSTYQSRNVCSRSHFTGNICQAIFFSCTFSVRVSSIYILRVCFLTGILSEWFKMRTDRTMFLQTGKLVEEEEGNFALWLSYILTGVGANLVSWLVLPRNAVSVGASGAVFGLFAISVLVKITWDWRKILEVLILGQFVIEKVMEAAQASAAMTGPFRGGYPVQTVNHIAHLSGALVGVVLVWLVSRIPSPSDHEGKTSQGKSGKIR